MRSLPKGAQDFIDRNPKFLQVLKSFSYLFSERVIKIGIGFFLHALLARHLGPEHFGKLSYVVKTVTVFFTFGLFGVDELIIKHLMEKKFSEEDIFKTVLKLRFRMSIVGWIALGIFVIIFRPEGYIFSLLTFLYGINILLQVFNVFDLKFHAAMDFRPLFWANNLSYLSASFFRLMGIFLNFNITYFLATYIWGEISLKVLVLRIVGWRNAFRGVFSKELSRSLIAGSVPFFLSTFVMLLDQRLSFFFIEKYRSLEELGNYSVAVTLVDLWLFLPTAIATATFPTIITSFNGNLPSYKTRVQYLSDILVWVAFAFSAGVFLTSDIVVGLLYGDKYISAPEALSLFSLTTIPVFFNIARIKWMTLESHLKDWLWINVICLSFNIFGHMYLVPLYGIKGAISSFLISQIMGNVMAAVFFRSGRKSVFIFLKTLFFPFRLIGKAK